MPEVKHAFGGSWTRTKLERLSAYLPHFTEEFGSDFTTLYVDGFAGTGKVDRREPKRSARPALILFPEPPPLHGSAQRALEITPAFDRYMLIDKNPVHCHALRQLRESFQSPACRVQVKCGDANVKLARLCAKTKWQRTRAVFFLDPYGMAVDWSTLERIAATEAADVWYLFPLNAALRMLPRYTPPADKNRPKLDRFFGGDWSTAFYRSREETHWITGRTATLTHRCADQVAVIEHVRKRLESIFTWVAEKPLRIVTHDWKELFTLFFFTSIPGRRTTHGVVADILSIPSTAVTFPARFAQLRNRTASPP